MSKSKKKAGRPELKNKKRTNYIMVSLNDNEKEKFENLIKSNHLDPNKRGVKATFIRHKILNLTQSEYYSEEKFQFTKLIYELNKIGNNINQIAFVINKKAKSNQKISVLDEIKMLDLF